jgi:hypothetical protein
MQPLLAQDTANATVALAGSLPAGSLPRSRFGKGLSPDRRSLETMFLTKLKTAALVLVACPAFTSTGLLVHPALAENPPQAQAKAEPNAANQGMSDAVTELTPAQFGKFHALLRPKVEEMRFGQIPWLFDLWEARTKAAAEGKPLVILGAAGNPCGTC